MLLAETLKTAIFTAETVSEGYAPQEKGENDVIRRNA